MDEKPEGVTIAWVRWFDASYQRGECAREDLVPVVEIQSAGLLIHEDEQSISLALDQYDKDQMHTLQTPT
jgi:hypothetical protein